MNCSRLFKLKIRYLIPISSKVMIYRLCLPVVSVFAICCSLVSAAIPATEREALIAIYNATGGSAWSRKDNWLGPPGSEAAWFGVKVENERVTELELRGNNLRGGLPPDIGNLAALRVLNLGNRLDNVWLYPVPNYITAVPAEIGRLANLSMLNLRYNRLQRLPESIGNLSQLTQLDVASNQLDELPLGIGRLLKLEILRIDDNPLPGLPETIGNLRNLRLLYASGSRLSSLPEGFGSLISLRDLFLTGTALVELPSTFGGLASLERAFLEGNQLERLPASIGKLARLTQLNLFGNKLDSFPPEIGGLSQLSVLHAGRNRLTSLPEEIGRLGNLKTIYLFENQLRQLPSSVGDLSSLQTLELSRNELEKLPPEIGRLKNLNKLWLDSNNLSNLSAEIGNLSSLESLNAEDNRLSGLIPAELGKLEKLRSLNLANNQLSGPIPLALTTSRLSVLQGLDLSHNRLEGPIPPEITQLPLSGLDLSHNRLSGSIPEEFERYRISVLKLNNNHLSGRIPAGLAKSPLWSFNIASNQLTGPVPTEFVRLTNLTSSHTDFRWNGLVADEPHLADFLSRKQGVPFEETQTIPPSGIRVEPLGPTSVKLTWTPIVFSDIPGGYEVFYSETSGGPYKRFDITPDKTTSSMRVTGVRDNYFFVVRTVTFPHEKNQNTVVSEFSREVQASTPPEQFTAFFPAFPFQAGQFGGFAVSNPSDKPALIRLQAFLSTGAPAPLPLNPVQMQLAPGEQIARLGSELFGSQIGQSVWVEMTSDNERISPLFQLGTERQLDGVSAVGRPSNTLYFSRILEGPSVLQGQSARTLLTIINPNAGAVKIVLRLYRAERRNRPGQGDEAVQTAESERILSGKGFLLGSISEIFGIESVERGYVKVEVSAGEGVVGFQWISVRAGESLLGLNAATPALAFRTFSAQLASGPTVITSIKVINPAAEPRRVYIRVISPDLKEPSPYTVINVPPFGIIEDDVRSFFSFPERLVTGTLIVEDGLGLISDVIFREPGGEWAAGLPLQTRTFTEAVFSHIANTDRIYTGLALYNGNVYAAEISIGVFSETGEQTGEAKLTLGGGGRLSRLLSELVPATAGQARGYILIKSTQPLGGQLLFGDQRGTFLSAAPPTILKGF